MPTQKSKRHANQRDPTVGRRSKIANNSFIGSQNVYSVMNPRIKSLGGFPSRTRVRLAYKQVLSLNPAAGSIDSSQFSLRGMYDPWTTGAGHQPSNFDRWMSIYNRYAVVSAKIKMTTIYNSTSAVAPGLMGFLVSASGAQVSGFSSLETLLEEPFVKYSTTPVGLLQNTISNGLTAQIRSRDWLDVKDDVLESEDYYGTSGANPSQDVSVEFFLGAIDGNDPGAQPFLIELEYDAVFFNPKITLPS